KEVEHLPAVRRALERLLERIRVLLPLLGLALGGLVRLIHRGRRRLVADLHEPPLVRRFATPLDLGQCPLFRGRLDLAAVHAGAAAPAPRTAVLRRLRAAHASPSDPARARARSRRRSSAARNGPLPPASSHSEGASRDGSDDASERNSSRIL